MSGFHRQRLGQLRRAAGLGSPIRRRSAIKYLESQDDVPMPSFLKPGARLPGDREAEYITKAYFSPEALHWADAVCDYRARGGRLTFEDEECFARVWEAMRAGRKPTKAQQREFKKEHKWKWAEAQVPELYAIEMQARGHKNYGPDYELPDDVEGPGSPQELIYKYLYRQLGYKSPASAKTRHNEWKAELRGTH